MYLDSLITLFFVYLSSITNFFACYKNLLKSKFSPETEFQILLIIKSAVKRESLKKILKQAQVRVIKYYTL